VWGHVLDLCRKQCWQYRDLVVTAEQCLYGVKAFSASHSTPLVSRLGLHKKLTGDTAGTDDPSWPKGYSMAYDVMLTLKREGKKKEPLWVVEPCFPGDGWTPACRGEAVNEFLIFLCLCEWLLFYLLICLFLSHGFSHFYPSDSLPHPTRKEWVSGCLMLSCWLGLNHNILLSSPTFPHLHCGSFIWLSVLQDKLAPAWVRYGPWCRYLLHCDRIHRLQQNIYPSPQAAVPVRRTCSCMGSQWMAVPLVNTHLLQCGVLHKL